MMPPIEAWIILGIILMPWIVPSLVWYIIGYILKIKKGDSWRVKDFVFPFPDELMGIEIGEGASLPLTNLILLFQVIYRCLRPYVCEKLAYCGRGFNRLLNYEVIKGEDKKESKTGESKKPGLWVARDENGTLCLYLGKPKKNEFLWEGTESTMGIYSDCLPDHCNSLWIDDEPIEVKLVKV
jgi:hypothetical protein